MPQPSAGVGEIAPPNWSYTVALNCSCWAVFRFGLGGVITMLVLVCCTVTSTLLVMLWNPSPTVTVKV